MATIRKREDSYKIRVSCGYDKSGNQVTQTKTWKPDKGMTPKQIEKELNRQMVMFEEACNNGYQSKAIKFQDFAEDWFKQYAETKLKTQIVRCYHNCEGKVYNALGHLRMDKITTRTIQTFIVDLAGEKRYDSKGKELPPYAPKTVRNYISFISSIFDYAVRMQVLSNNPCKNVVLPSKKSKDREVYSLDEVQQMLELFENESEANYKYTIFFTLAVFTGLRRGELLGLEQCAFHKAATRSYGKAERISGLAERLQDEIGYEVDRVRQIFHENRRLAYGNASAVQIRRAFLRKDRYAVREHSQLPPLQRFRSHQ